MATFANGESGLSVRTKINNVLQHADGTAGELVINDAGADVDFRVESDTLTNALFVDGATGRVGINAAAPAQKLHITGSGGVALIRLDDGAVPRNNYIGVENYEQIILSANEDNAGGATPIIKFRINGTDSMRIDTSRRVLIGTTTASGANLLQVNSDATINTVRIGLGAGAGPTNTVVGSVALNANTTGASNVAVGLSALRVNTTGNENTALGTDALYSNTSGNANTAIGTSAKYRNTTGANNTAVGHVALFNNTTGAANIAIGQNAGLNLTTGSNNTIIGSIAGTAGLANTVIIGAGATERLRIDSNGNMLLGTDFAIAKVVARESMGLIPTAVNTLGSSVELRSAMGASSSEVFIANELVGFNNAGNYSTALKLFTRSEVTNAERMRITATGDVIIGRTTTDDSVQGFGYYNSRVNSTSASAAAALFNRQSSDGDIVLFRRANTGVGSISVTTSATAYNTTSDYRLKEGIQPVADATERLMELKPVNFAWKADGSRTDGFIAHEVQAVVPQAVTGEKDGDDMQQMDHSKLVPLLTAALQKAIQQIELLEARLDAANL